MGISKLCNLDVYSKTTFCYDYEIEGLKLTGQEKLNTLMSHQ